MVLRWNTAVNSADPGAITYFAAIHVQPVCDHARRRVEDAVQRRARAPAAPEGWGVREERRRGNACGVNLR